MKRFSPHTFIVGILCILSISETLAQPTADFTATKTSGCSPLVVTFQNLSSAAQSYEWSTGVSTTTLSNPTVLYTNPGSYPVTLVAIDAQGLRDTLIRQQYITVYDNPLSDFSVSSNQVCVHTPISFTDGSSPGSGTITSWQWDFGDGKSATGPSPSHSYTAGGQFPVSLSVTNSFGCTNSVLKNNLITIDAPETNFSSSPTVSCGAPLTVNFLPQQSTGLTHQWTFGDGNSSSQPIASHTYTSIGSYDVSHIVTDATGCSDTLSFPSYVNIGAGTLSASADDSTACTGDLIHFSALAPPTSSITWDFGNGTMGTGLTADYSYPTPGQYTVTVQISDPGGCQVTRQIPISVEQLPSVAFSVVDTPIGCSIPFTVDFVNQSSGATSYFWNFFSGSPAISTLPNPSVTYTALDSVNVRLTAYGAGGCVNSVTKKRYIKILPTVAGFEQNTKKGCAPLTVSFQDTSRTHYPIVNWQWDFGDGHTGSGPSPTHTYVTPGTYDVRLITMNSRGCSDTLIIPNHISAGTRPSANFVADTTVACALSDVSFINLSTGASDYTWYFGDGDTAMSVNPSHGFAALGMMDVTLVASNKGCSDTLYRPLYIQVLEPLPVIGMTSRYLCDTPETVHFVNLSIGDDTWSWTLPDGSVVTDSITHYTFSQTGQFPVSLMVSNLTTGCQVEITDSVYVQPIMAHFGVDKTEGCHPVTIQFTDSTTGAIDWSWDFGNGKSSTDQHPLYTYLAKGIFDVSLTVENKFGCKGTYQLDSIRSVSIKPQIETRSPLQGCSPLSVAFEDASLSWGAKSLSWLWDFGDGSISTLQHPVHVYTQPGIYTVTLTVSSDIGCSKTKTYNQQIIVTDPQPSFTIQPGVSCPGGDITFVSTSTGDGLQYLWDLGDGSSSVLATPVHAYSDTGYVDISLMITDAFGCTRTATQSQAIYIQDLFAAFEADTTFAACPPLNVNFQAAEGFLHPGLTYEWDFGDGSSATSSNPSRVFTQPGSFDVTLIVSTPFGCSDTLIKPGYITIEGPSANFSFTPDSGCPGTEVDFMATSPDSVTYQWIYGDGATGAGATSSHQYQTPGSYLPVLVIEDTDGCTVFSYARNPIEIFSPPSATFSPITTEACDSMTVAFQDNSAGSITSWLWTFGDGGNSTQQHPDHLYQSPGIYPVSLLVRDQNGCTDSMTRVDVVTIYPSPTPSIGGSLLNECAPQTLSLTAQSNGHPSQLTNWSWYSGNQQHQGPNWNPTFTQAGFHSINLEVTDLNGCTGLVTALHEVYPNPVAGLSVDDQESCAPIQLHFSDNSQGNPISWFWDFGEGGTSTQKNPLYSYQQDGVYDVALIVENLYGCKDTMVEQAYIRLIRPAADFSPSDVTGCPGTTFIFTDQSQSQRPLASWSWQMGDGNTGTGNSIHHQYQMSGEYGVTLIVEDVEGCTDTLYRPQLINVEDNAPAIPVQIEVASVISDHGVHLHFEAYNDRRNDFGAYLIYRSEDGISYQLVDSLMDKSLTTYQDQALNTRDHRYWYKVVPRNNCFNPAPWDSIRAHATVQLTTSPGIDEAYLSWSSYQGWDHIDRYEVYRVTGYTPGTGIFLGATSADDTSFVDLGFRCDENYSYRVIAVLGNLEAGSDSSFTDPFHPGPSDPTDLIRATVEGDQSVYIEWTDPQIEMPESLLIERNEGNGFMPISVTPYDPGISKSTDTGARTSEASYVYRVSTIDSCGDVTPIGMSGKTILLEAERQFAGTRLQWTAYEGWESGVEGYTIELWDERLQQWIVVKQVSGTVLQYVDDHTELNQTQYCYRVIGYEFRGNQAISVSNEICVEPEPYLYTANAFTPNGDGYNDEFQIGMAFVGQASIEIYNRWGKKVFAASSLDQSWNGQTMEGAPAPEGVYVYKLIATGFDGSSVSRNGTITLLR